MAVCRRPCDLYKVGHIINKNNKVIIAMNAQNVNTYEETFYIIPRYIRKLEGITLTFLDFFETIFQFWNKGKSCFLSNALIKKRAGIKSDSTINDAFKFFEKQGVMKRIQKDGRRYIVPVISKIETDSEVSLQREGGLATARGGVSVQRDINKELINKEIKEKEINKEKEKKEKGLANKSPIILFLLSNNPFGFDEDTIKGYLEMRKSIKKPLTERAWILLMKEIQKAVDKGVNPLDCINEAILRSWQGFKYEWLQRPSDLKIIQPRASEGHYNRKETVSTVPFFEISREQPKKRTEGDIKTALSATKSILSKLRS